MIDFKPNDAENVGLMLVNAILFMVALLAQFSDSVWFAAAKVITLVGSSLSMFIGYRNWRRSKPYQAHIRLADWVACEERGGFMYVIQRSAHNKGTTPLHDVFQQQSDGSLEIVVADVHRHVNGNIVVTVGSRCDLVVEVRYR